MSLLLEVTAWLVLAAQLVAIAWVDWRTRRIPNRLTASLLLSGLAVAGLTGVPTPAASLGGALLGGGFLLAIALGFRRLRGLDGLGLGDVKFLAGAGAWTGWQGVGPVVFLAAVAALAVVGAGRWAGVTLDRREPIPFGPALCLALVAVRAAQQALGLWR